MPDEPGRYYVAVFDQAHACGDYVLAIGDKESFGMLDLPGVLWTALRIRPGARDHSAFWSETTMGLTGKAINYHGQNYSGAMGRSLPTERIHYALQGV